MKLLLAAILALGSTPLYAQTMTKAQLTSLMQSRKATLETVKIGMSKSVHTTSSVKLEDGSKCDYTVSAVQSILRFEGDKMIVLSQENFNPASSAACLNAGFESFKESVVYYEPKPTVAQDIKDLNESEVKSISRSGEIITMTVNGKVTLEDGTMATESMTVKYDLSKPSFRNMILSESPAFKIITSDLSDLNLDTVDLTAVLFCANNDGDNSECVRGDFSDILF